MFKGRFDHLCPVARQPSMIRNRTVLTLLGIIMVNLTITTVNVLSQSFRFMILNVLEINIVFAFKGTATLMILCFI